LEEEEVVAKKVEMRYRIWARRGIVEKAFEGD
jgi:hypothetical protein